jgi:S1-C subfamily serine protease
MSEEEFIMNGHAHSNSREHLDAHEWKLVVKWAAFLAVWLLILFALGGCAGHFRSDAARFARIANSTVIVSDGSGLGSGTIVGKEPGRTLVLTAFHVVRGSTSIRVAGNRAVCPAVVAKASEEEDLALLRVLCDLGQPILPIARVAPPRFSRVYLVGAMNGYPDTPGAGYLARRDFGTEGLKSDAYLVVAPMFSGDSGGTLVNERGELVAVPSRMPTYGMPVYVAPSADQADDEDAPHARFPAVARGIVPGLGVFVGLPTIRRFLGLSS